jgi:hypothetical protein
VTARLLALGVVALLSACGPDCTDYCKKLRECNRLTDSDQEKQCRDGCEEYGTDATRTYKCIIEHTCSDIAAGHCDVNGRD